jgi:hypothetical protein
VSENWKDYTVLEINPEDRQARKLFQRLPFRLYRDTPQWVPPLQIDAERILERDKHPFFKNGEAVFYLALDEAGSPVGRVAVLHNRAYNDFNHDKAAFFTCFECENDPAAAMRLFECAFSWARSRNLDKVIGPKGFTALDGMGLLVKGFEHRPAFGLPYNPPYYPALIEGCGFSGCGDIVSGYLNPETTELPEKIRRAADLVEKRSGMRVVRFKNKMDFARMIPRLQALYNAALEGTTGNIPLSEDDVKTMANQLLWFADPRLIKLILKDDELIGFLLAYPDISAAVQRCRGRLFPTGWIDLLLETRRSRWVNINGAAIVEKYRGMGGTALLFREMYASIREGKFQHADLVQIGVENEKMQLELRNLGIVFYKTHRLYQANALPGSV